MLLLTGIQSAPRNRVGCSGEDFWDVSLGCSSFLWCGALGSLQHIRMTCLASCLTKRATEKHRQIDPFRVRQSHPIAVSSSSTPGSEETSTTALRRLSSDIDALSAVVVLQALIALGRRRPSDPEPKRSSPCGSARPSQIQAYQHSTHTHLSTHTNEIFPPTHPPTQLRNNLVLTGTSVDQKRTLELQEDALSQKNGTS